MAKLFSLVLALALGALWFSQPVLADSASDMIPNANRMGASYAAPPPAVTPSGPVKSPARTKSGVTDDSVMRRATKKPNR